MVASWALIIPGRILATAFNNRIISHSVFSMNSKALSGFNFTKKRSNFFLLAEELLVTYTLLNHNLFDKRLIEALHKEFHFCGPFLCGGLQADEPFTEISFEFGGTP